MMSINVLLYEDREESINKIISMVKRISDNIHVLIGRSKESFNRLFFEYDICFFIIATSLMSDEGKRVSGYEMASVLRSIRRYRFSDIIFVSYDMDTEYIAYNHFGCFRILDSSSKDNMLRMTLSDVYMKFRTQYLNSPIVNKMYVTNHRGRVNMFRIGDIIWLEIHRKYCIIYTEKDEIELYRNEFPVSDEDLGRNFLLCNRSDYVSFSRISSVRKKERELEIRNFDMSIRISDSGMKRLREYLIGIGEIIN